MDVDVAVGLPEQRRDQGSREITAGGPLPADGSAEAVNVAAPVAAVVALELELELASMSLRTPVCSSSFSSSCWRRAVQMELAPTYQVPMELAPSS